VKRFLYEVSASFLSGLIVANSTIGNVIIDVLGRCFSFFSFLLSKVSVFVLTSIDKERYDHTASVIQQSKQLTELNLLKAAVEVKEDAVRNRVWTMQHTAAINRIGNILHFQYGWEVTRVHGYLRQIVESIPNMTYGAMDE
jgi:hypothetical protein